MGTSSVRKTRLMREAEIKFQQPLELVIPDLVIQFGQLGAAAQLGVSKATIGYWCLKLGINLLRVALAPGETLEVKGNG